MAEEVTADDNENDKSAAAAMASKEETDDDESSVMKEIAIRSSKPTVFNPVDWSKCLKWLKSGLLKWKIEKKVSFKNHQIVTENLS